MTQLTVIWDDVCDMFFGLDWKIGNDAKWYEKAKKWYIRKLNKKSLNTYLSDPSLRHLPILRWEIFYIQRKWQLLGVLRAFLA